MLDATGAQALGEIVEDLEHRHITVLLKGPRPEHEKLLRAVGALDRLANENHLFTDLDEAIAHARTHVARRANVARLATGDRHRGAPGNRLLIRLPQESNRRPERVSPRCRRDRWRR